VLIYVTVSGSYCESEKWHDNGSKLKGRGQSLVTRDCIDLIEVAGCETCESIYTCAACVPQNSERETRRRALLVTAPQMHI
jgi:hypothetical protein